MSNAGALALAERIMALFAEGSFSATYKHAVLLALLDLCFEKTSRTGVPPTSVTTRELAEAVLELYWPQCVPWETGRYLRQGGGAKEQAEILSHIIEFRRDLGGADSQPLWTVRRSHPDRLEHLLRFVEWKLIEMPLPRLQVLGRREERFLYQYQWTASIRRAEVSAYQRGQPSDFDNTLRLLPGVAEGLISLNGLLRPLIRREWLRLIQQMNDQPETRLEGFLFGQEREQLAAVRGPLSELQGGRCFFCEDRLAAKADVDHFVPWSRIPNNAVENLVVAHKECNHDKRDFLASVPHVERWTAHVAAHASDLALIADRTAVPTAAERSQGIAAALYLLLPAGALLWQRGDEFVPLDHGAIRRVLRVA